MRQTLSAIGLGIFISGLGLIALYLFGRTTDLTCTRLDEGTYTCRTETSFYHLLTLDSSGIRDLTGAGVDESCDDDDCTYRVLLQTSRGPKPLTSYYSSGYREKERIANQIIASLQEGRPSFELSVGPGFVGTLVPLLFILMGPIMVYARLRGALISGGFSADLN